MTDHWFETVEGTVWPVNVGNIEWGLRYLPNNPLRDEARLTAASVLHAYRVLTDPSLPQTDAIAKLKRARKAQVQANAKAKVEA